MQRVRARERQREGYQTKYLEEQSICFVRKEGKWRDIEEEMDWSNRYLRLIKLVQSSFDNIFNSTKDACQYRNF